MLYNTKMVVKYYTFIQTLEYEEWYSSLSVKKQFQIDDRLSRIELEGYFGDCKSVSDDKMIWELKWKNGRRVYYVCHKDQLLLLIGGNKNGQSKDITAAKRIYAKYT